MLRTPPDLKVNATSVEWDVHSNFRLANQWKSLQNDRNSLQQFQTAVEDFLGRLVAMENSFTRLGEETAKPEVVQNEDLAKEYLEQFRVSTLVWRPVSRVLSIAFIGVSETLLCHLFFLLFKCQG